MKTFFRDFSIIEKALAESCDELEEITSYRQEKFNLTSQYKSCSAEFEKIIEKIKELLPEESAIIRELENAVLGLESINYSAAYRDGMADLMTTITLNNLHLTKVEYFSKK